MGVYIKGMKMPDNCCNCPRGDAADGWYCKLTGHIYNWGNPNRASWCPLIPVPPQGDLIDRDAMYKAINDARKEDPLLADVYVDDYVIVSDWLRNASTIIPADGAKIARAEEAKE